VKLSSQSSVSTEFLELASRIVRDTEAQEGAMRTAISRSYYSVYLTVRDQLFGPDGRGLRRVQRKLARKFNRKRKRTPGSHELVLFAIKDLTPTATMRPLTLYQQIDELKEARVHADYHFTDENLKDIPYDAWPEYADRMVALASQILPVARRLPPYSLA